jgi:hypothetical protein
MAEIGTVTGFEIKPNKDGTSSRRMLQVKFNGDDDDIQTVEQFCEFGNDSVPIIDLPDASPPVVGTKVIVISITESWKIAIAADDNIEPSMLEGEKKLYSLDNTGAISAFINWLNTGIIEINGNADFAVAFTDLKTAFDQLKTDFDDLVSKYNGHIHTTTATVSTGSPGVISATTSTDSPTTADIDPAKVDTVKLP